MTAAKLDDVLQIRDQGGVAAMRAYESTYGVLAEGSMHDWQQDDQVVEITAAEFEQVWTRARQAVEQVGGRSCAASRPAWRP